MLPESLKVPQKVTQKADYNLSKATVMVSIKNIVLRILNDTKHSVYYLFLKETQDFVRF